MRTVAFGDVLRLSYGKALKQADRSGGPVPVVGSGGIVGWHETGLTPGPTVVVGRKGSIGSVTWVDGPAWPIDTSYFLEPIGGGVHMRWTYWLLQSLGLNGMNKSAAVPGLNREDVYRLTIPLPPLEEQRRVAAILDHADALGGKRRRVIAHLDAMTQAVFFDKFGQRSDDPSRRVRLDSVANVTTGNSPSRARPELFGGDLEWIKSDNLGGPIATRAAESLSDLGREVARVAPAGSVLVTCIAGSPRSIAKSSLVDREVAFNQQINAILPGPDLDPIFLLAQLQTFPQLVRDKSTGGMKGLVTKSALRSVRLLVPELVEQRDFRRRSETISRHHAHLLGMLEVDDELFASLQHRAFAGEL